MLCDKESEMRLDQKMVCAASSEICRVDLVRCDKSRSLFRPPDGGLRIYFVYLSNRSTKARCGFVSRDETRPNLFLCFVSRDEIVLAMELFINGVMFLF